MTAEDFLAEAPSAEDFLGAPQTPPAPAAPALDDRGEYRSGRATVFGLDLDGRPDAQDNGIGAWGMNTRDPSLVGVSLPRRTLREVFGDENKAKGRLVEVINPATGQKVLAPIVDKGPADWTGNALDLTYGAAKALGSTGRDTMQFRFADLTAEDFLNAPEPTTTSDVVNSFARGALDQGVGAAVEGFARGVAAQRPTLEVPDWMDAAKGMLNGLPGMSLVQTGQEKRRSEGAADLTRDLREEVRLKFPVSDAFAESLTGQIVTGLGQAIPSLGSYAIPGVGPVAAFSQIYDEGYHDAIRAGATPEKANDAALKYLPAGALDYLGDKLLLGRILKPLKGKITVGDLLKGTGVAAVGEGLTEGAQQMWLNAVAKLEGYDPDRKLDDGVINSMIVGAVVGGTLSGAGSVATNAFAQPPEPGIPLSEVRVVGQSAEEFLDTPPPLPTTPTTDTGGIGSQSVVTPPAAPPAMPLAPEETQTLVREFSFPAGLLDFLPAEEARRVLASQPGSARGIAELQAAIRTAREAQKAKQETTKPGTEEALDPELVPFSQTPAPAIQPAEHSAVRKAIAAMLKPWQAAPPVTVADTVADAPQTRGGKLARQHAANGAIVEGWVEGGRVHLIAEGIAQVAAMRGIPATQRAQEVLLHEAVGHYGIGGVLKGASRREYQSIIDGALKRMPGAQRAELARSYGFDLQNANHRAALAEEYLARLAEPGGPMQTWAQQLWARLRALLRRVFPGMSLTDGDLALLLRRGLERLQPAPDGIKFAMTQREGQDLQDGQDSGEGNPVNPANPDNPVSSPQFSIQPRGHVATTQRMTDVAPEVSAPMASSYETANQAELETRAREEVAADLNSAFAQFRQQPIADVYGMVLGHELALRLQDAGRHADATEVREKMAAALTTPAQMLWYISTIAKTSPEGVQRLATKITETAAQAGGKLTPDVQAMLAELQRLQAELDKARQQTGNSAVVSIEEALKALGLTPQRLSELQVRLRDILVSGHADPKLAHKRLVALLMSHGGLTQARAEQMAAAALREFTRGAKSTRDKLLKDLIKAEFPGKPEQKAKLKTLFQKWIAMNQAGALDDETLYAGIAAKYGIPVFTRQKADQIAALQRAWAAAPEGPVKLAAGAEMMDAIYGMVPSSLWEKVATLFKLVKLFGLKTLGRNVLGSGITQAAETVLDGTVGKLYDVPFGTKPGFYLGARWRGLRTPFDVARQGYDYGRAQGRPGLGDAVKTLIAASRFYSRGIYDAGAINSATKAHVFDSRLGRLFEDTMQLLIGTSDLAFFQSAVQADLARSEAAAKARGDWTGAHTQEMIEHAQLAGARATFTDETQVGSALTGIRKGLNKLTGNDQFGIGTVLLPYTRVPGSILEKGAMTWSPLGFVRGIYQAARGGSADEVLDAFTRATAGTATVALGLYLARLGIITGGAEDDEDLRKLRQMQGFGQFAVNLSELKRRMLSMNWTAPAVPPQEGDVIKSYAWAQPTAMPLAIGAHIGQLEKQGRAKSLREVATPDNLMNIALRGGLGAVMEQPMFMGLSRFAQEADRDPAKAALSLAVGAVDFTPQIVGNIREATDNIRPETRAGDPLEAAAAQKLARLPGTKYPPRYDLLGKLDERYHENVLLNALANPILSDRIRTSPELQMLEHLMAQTGRTDFLPRTVPVKIQVTRPGEKLPTEVKLTPQQVSDMQRMVGRLTADMFADHAASPVFARLPPAQQADVLATELASIYNAGKMEILGDTPLDIRTRIPVQRGLAGVLPMQFDPTGRPVSLSLDRYALAYRELARRRGYTPAQ